MSVMTSQISNFMDLSKAQKSKDIGNKIFFLQMKKPIFIKNYNLVKNNFVAELTFKHV